MFLLSVISRYSGKLGFWSSGSLVSLTRLSRYTCTIICNFSKRKKHIFWMSDAFANTAWISSFSGISAWFRYHRWQTTISHRVWNKIYQVRIFIISIIKNFTFHCFSVQYIIDWESDDIRAANSWSKFWPRMFTALHVLRRKIFVCCAVRLMGPIALTLWQF